MQDHTKIALDASDEVAMDDTFVFSSFDKIVNMFVAANFIVIITIELLVVSFNSKVMHLKEKSDLEF